MRLRFWTRRAITPDRPVDCKTAARVLQSYLDGELDGITAGLVSEHLETCRVCGLEAHTYTAIKQAIAADRSPSADAVRRLERFADDLMRGDVTPT